MTTAFKIVGSEHVAQSPVGNTFEDAADVALSLAPEAPTFCYSAEVVHSRAHSFLTGFPGEVAYAVKQANDCAGCSITGYDSAIKVPRPAAPQYSKLCSTTSTATVRVSTAGAGHRTASSPGLP